MRQLCNWPGFETASEEGLRFIQKLVDFFTNDYLDILESAQYHIVYHYDERWPKLTGVAEAEEDEAEGEHAEADVVEEESDDEEEEEDDEDDVVVVDADGTVRAREVDADGTVRTRELSAEDIAAAEAASAAADAADAAAGVVAGGVAGAVAGGVAGAIAGGATGTGGAADEVVSGGTISGGTLGSGSTGVVGGPAPAKGKITAAAIAKAKAKAQRKAKACAPRPTKQGTVTRTAEGKAVLTKHNGIVVPYVSKAAAVKELTEKSHTHGFDHISAVSQASINAWFKSLWSVASSSKSTADSLLSRFSYEQYFSTSFQAPTIRLLSDNKAIIWIHLQDGWLKTLKNWAPCGE